MRTRKKILNDMQKLADKYISQEIEHYETYEALAKPLDEEFVNHPVNRMKTAYSHAKLETSIAIDNIKKLKNKRINITFSEKQ